MASGLSALLSRRQATSRNKARVGESRRLRPIRSSALKAQTSEVEYGGQFEIIID